MQVSPSGSHTHIPSATMLLPVLQEQSLCKYIISTSHSQYTLLIQYALHMGHIHIQTSIPFSLLRQDLSRGLLLLLLACPRQLYPCTNLQVSILWQNPFVPQRDGMARQIQPPLVLKDIALSSERDTNRPLCLRFLLGEWFSNTGNGV